MKYIYDCIANKFDQNLLNKINSACNKLSRKFSEVNLSSLNVSEYNQRYLGGQINNIRPVLQTYSYLILLALKKNDTPLDKICIVDYGGGAGVISLLCKEIGFGSVIYNDIYDVSLTDAKKIGAKLNLLADGYVLGDVDDLNSFCHSNNFFPNVIVSFDVIEHIYDVEEYIEKLSRVRSKRIKLVFGSGANRENPLLNRKYKKAQKYVEHSDREVVWGQKLRDSNKSYFSIRRKIIEEYAPSLRESELEELADRTRGQIKSDIIISVDEYLTQKKITYVQAHPTNTCDPLTGNWAEHLMEMDWLISLFSSNGFQAEVLPGCWGHSSSKLKRMAIVILNRIIKSSKSRPLAFAPFYIIVASR